jgi:cardiolipin synthase
VRVIIPYKIDSGVINRSNIITANALLNNGIRVYIYPGMSHVKAAIYDGWGCFGSANFDNLSFRINKELNLATSDTDAVNALKQQVFLPDLEQSVELTEPLPNNWLDRLAELLADTM